MRADGSGPWLCVLQGKRATEDEAGAITARWECARGNNDQVAIPPAFVAWQWVHFYGSYRAYRPYRATAFSEGAYTPSMMR